ncbi:MAG: MFS transporter [Ilumatobacteraceae bacterium]
MAGVDALPPSSATDDLFDDIELDPRRWLTLGILITTVILIAVDTSVLNVSIPTILRDFDTTVPTLQWVITGYSLTFATLLIVGGRLGDIYGHRRLFLIGVSLFGIGSFVASEAGSVGELIIGEAIIEGIGAALMTPATLSILSTTFRGRERATAFAAWGAAAGAAVAFGPVLGGFLTTNYSWRWSFRINVVVAPIAVIGAFVLMKAGKRKARTPIDIPGAALIALGLFLIVFALSDGGRYGWFAPIDEFRVGGITIWPASMPIGIVPVSALIGTALLVGFVRLERSKERREAHPLFQLSMMEHKTFRYGLLTLLILAMGQLGLLLALPLFLQDAVHLSAQENGLWLLPLGLFVIVGSQVGGRLTLRFSTTTVVRIGLSIEAFSLLLVIWAVTPDITFWRILPGLAVFGIGLGFASSQLTSVILSEIAIDRSGVASGASSTARQIGAALGAAVIGSLITVQTTNNAVSALGGMTDLPDEARTAALAGVRAFGPSFRPTATLPLDQIARIEAVIGQSLADATRIALAFAAALVALGALASFLIPRHHPSSQMIIEIPVASAAVEAEVQ